MVEIIVGLTLMIGSVLMAIIFLATVGGTTTGLMFWGPLVGFAAAFAAGTALFMAGRKKAAVNKNTDENGTKTLGLILSVDPDVVSASGQCYYRAKVKFFDADNNLKEMEERIDNDPDEYQVGDVYRIKYCENDINILEEVWDNTVTEEERPLFNKLKALWNDEQQTGQQKE